MRATGFLIALVVLAHAIPLRAQKLVVDSLVAVRPFGNPERYCWPVVRMPGNYAIARRINSDLFMWSERFVDPDTSGVRYFDGVWGIPPEASGIQMWPPQWSWERPMRNLLSLSITAEWCGAYCEGSTQHYHYDLRDGSRVQFDSLFTPEGLRQVRHLVGGRWRRIIGDHLVALRDSSQRPPAEASGDWLMGAIDMYERCLAERETETPYVGDMVISKNGVGALVSRCAVHAEMALDDLSEVEVPLSRKEITALMRPEMRRWLGW